LLERASHSNVEIGELEFEAVGRRFVDYKAPSGDDVVGDDLLRTLGLALGADLTVNMAVALLGGASRKLRCDFREMTANGRTGAKFYVDEMMAAALPLLKALLSSERSAIDDIVERFRSRVVVDEH
jgi:hypothetical protein